MWDQVCEKYNSKQERDFRGLSDIPYRDVDAIRTKWKSLKNCKKPTGEPDCPPNVVRAKRIAREIENGSSVFQNGNTSSDNDDGKSTKSSGGSDSAGSDSDDASSFSDTASSPVQQRQILDQSAAGIVPETLDAGIVPETLIEVSSSDDEKGEIICAGSPSSQHIQELESDDFLHDAQIIPRTQVSKTAASKAKQSVPVRLGLSAEQLQEVADGLAGDKKKRKKDKTRVPENPSVTKKRTLSNELKEADQAFQESVEKREAEKQRRHSEEMKRLDNQHKIEEMRYQAEAVKSNALLSAVLMGVSAFSSMMQNPQLAQAIQSLVPRDPVNSAPPQDGQNL